MSLSTSAYPDFLLRLKSSILPSADERKAIRVNAGASLHEVADAMQVHPMTVLRWEQGATPRRETAIRYRQLLDALASDHD